MAACFHGRMGVACDVAHDDLMRTFRDVFGVLRRDPEGNKSASANSRSIWRRTARDATRGAPRARSWTRWKSCHHRRQ